MPSGVSAIYHKIKNKDRDYTDAILKMPGKGKRFIMRSMFEPEGTPVGAAEVMKRYNIIQKATGARKRVNRSSAVYWLTTDTHEELVKIIKQKKKEEAARDANMQQVSSAV